MNNGMKMTVKLLMIVMMATFAEMGGGHYKVLLGVNYFKKCNTTP